MLHCIAVCWIVVLQYGTVCCSVLQCVAVCCSVLQCALSHSEPATVLRSRLCKRGLCVALYIVVCRNLLQYVAMCTIT